jgi:hypothetical protein
MEAVSPGNRDGTRMCNNPDSQAGKALKRRCLPQEKLIHSALLMLSPVVGCDVGYLHPVKRPGHFTGLKEQDL